MGVADWLFSMAWVFSTFLSILAFRDADLTSEEFLELNSSEESRGPGELGKRVLGPATFEKFTEGPKVQFEKG